MKYSKPFQELINRCKKTKWVMFADGAIRVASDRCTCPMAFATGRQGICGDDAAIELGFTRDNFWTIANAADNMVDDDLTNKVRATLIAELKPKRLVEK